MPTNPTVAILGSPDDYAEFRKAFEQAGAHALVTTDLHVLRDADGMVIVGHHNSVDSYEAVKELQSDRVLGRRVAGARPVLVLGAGLGMLFETLHITHPALGEIEIAGLGEWPGTTQDLTSPGSGLGQQTVKPAASTKFLDNLPGAVNFEAEDGVLNWDFDQSIGYMEPPAVSWSGTEPSYIAAVENGPLTAVQFNPVTSGAAGEEFLRRWVSSLPVTNRL